MSYSRLRHFFVAGLAALLALGMHADAALAQSQATTGVIRGTVTDAQGQPVPGAEIKFLQQETGFARTLTTSGSGRFVASLLPVGTYNISASSVGFLRPAVRNGISVGLGSTVQINLAFSAVELEAIEVTGETPLIDASDISNPARLKVEAVEGLPNNGRNYLDFTTLTPGVSIVQGPDGDELTVSGQRGIFNNITVDGADFNNPFFGEQRGGQRPAFTFNLDAVQEIAVVNGNATAEFGRSSGGFINVITKSGTNKFKGTAHYFGQFDGISADFARGGGPQDFTQTQVGGTLGGPIVKDKAFFFFSWDQQIRSSVKQKNRLASISDVAGFNKLVAWTDTAFGGALRGDFGPVNRRNDGQAFLAKFDARLNDNNNATLKFNYTNSEQPNGTFDVDLWGKSANGLETDESAAVNFALSSQLSSSVANEFRGQFSRENRNRPYDGPTFPDGRPFPDVAIGEGFRFGMPFFLPIKDYDTRVQLLDNISLVKGAHLFKAGFEWNRTETKQTFIGFANARFIFSDVDSFLNYVSNGPDPNFPGGAPGNLLFLQFAPVPPITDINQAGTQVLTTNEYAAFLQDTWTPSDRVTIDYGLRWAAQNNPNVLTPPSQVFFAPFIGRPDFPSDGTIPSDWGMWQPRFGLSWNMDGHSGSVLRMSGGLFYSRIPALILAGVRTTNGSIAQNLVAIGGAFGQIPAFDQLLSTANRFPAFPGVTTITPDFQNPRTWAGNVSFEKELTHGLAASLTYQVRRTDHLFRFVDRNDAVFGSPFSSGLEFVPGDGSTGNGIFGLTSTEDNAHSIYHGVTLDVKGDLLQKNLQFDVNWTVSSDRSDDDNERDPFLFRYVRADRLDAEFGFSDRDQRHKLNVWLLAKLPGGFALNNRVTLKSPQPTSEQCGPGNVGNGKRANVIFGGGSDRICADGSIISRNTLRKDNAFFSWDLRATVPIKMSPAGPTLEPIIEVFNLTNADNFRDPGSTSLLFNFDGTIRSGFGNPRRVQVGARMRF